MSFILTILKFILDQCLTKVLHIILTIYKRITVNHNKLYQSLYVSLTVHLSIILVTDQLNAQIIVL